jgi:hypothetical protein
MWQENYHIIPHLGLTGPVKGLIGSKHSNDPNFRLYCLKKLFIENCEVSHLKILYSVT